MFSRALNGTLVQTQCFNADASAGCKRLGGFNSLRQVEVSPDGSHVYASDGGTLIPLARNADGSLAPVPGQHRLRQAGRLLQPLQRRHRLRRPAGPRAVDLRPGALARRRARVRRQYRAAPQPGHRQALQPNRATDDANHTPPLRSRSAPTGRRCTSAAARGSSASRAPRAPSCSSRWPRPRLRRHRRQRRLPTGGRARGAAVPKPPFGDLALDATGDSLYLASGFGVGPAVRSFSRVAGPPLPPPTVGRARLAPKTVRATAGRTARLTLIWEHPRNWRDLTRLELRLRSGGRPAGRVIFDKRSGRIRMRGDRDMRLIRTRSSIGGNGKTGKRLTLRAVLAVAPTLTPRTLLVDAAATDRHGHRQTITQVGTLRIKRAQ